MITNMNNTYKIAIRKTPIICGTIFVVIVCLITAITTGDIIPFIFFLFGLLFGFPCGYKICSEEKTVEQIKLLSDHLDKSIPGDEEEFNNGAGW